MKKFGSILLLFVIVIGISSLYFVNLQEKNKNANFFTDSKIFQLNEKINLRGENKSTGAEVQIEASVEKVVFNSESIAIFYQFEKPENIITSGINDIEVVMKNGEIYDLWKECEDKSMSYDKEMKAAVTYVVFSKPLILEEVEKIKVVDKYLGVL